MTNAVGRWEVLLINSNEHLMMSLIIKTDDKNWSFCWLPTVWPLDTELPWLSYKPSTTVSGVSCCCICTYCCGLTDAENGGGEKLAKKKTELMMVMQISRVDVGDEANESDDEGWSDGHSLCPGAPSPSWTHRPCFCLKATVLFSLVTHHRLQVLVTNDWQSKHLACPCSGTLSRCSVVIIEHHRQCSKCPQMMSPLWPQLLSLYANDLARLSHVLICNSLANHRRLCGCHGSSQRELHGTRVSSKGSRWTVGIFGSCPVTASPLSGWGHQLWPTSTCRDLKITTKERSLYLVKTCGLWPSSVRTLGKSDTFWNFDFSTEPSSGIWMTDSWANWDKNMLANFI